MKKFKQIRTGETVKWFAPENKTIELHVVKYTGTGLYGLVESWDNIDESSVLYGIAYGSARIVNSNVIGVIGHGALIEDSNVIMKEWWHLDDWTSVTYDPDCKTVRNIPDIEGLHVKNCLIDGPDTHYYSGTTLKSGGWVRAREEFIESPIAKELFDFKEVYEAPDYQKIYKDMVGHVFDNTPYTVARLKLNELNGLKLEVDFWSYCSVEPYDKGRDMKVFNDDYMDLSW